MDSSLVNAMGSIPTAANNANHRAQSAAPNKVGPLMMFPGRRVAGSGRSDVIAHVGPVSIQSPLALGYNWAMVRLISSGDARGVMSTIVAMSSRSKPKFQDQQPRESGLTPLFWARKQVDT